MPRGSVRSLVAALAGVALGAVAVAAVLVDRSDSDEGRSVGDRVEEVDSHPGNGQSFVRVLAPSRGCWQLSLGESVASSDIRLEEDCGPTVVPIDPSEGIVSLGRQQEDWWDLGMRIVVNGVVVRDIQPAPYDSLSVHWSDGLPETTIVARLTAPADGCWIATIEDEIEEGCGSRDLSLDVRGEVNVVFERDPPGAWTWCLNLEVDGRVVQTLGPGSNPVQPLGFRYAPPEPGYGANVEVEPVRC
jgi:hypothetical protein